MWVDPSRRNEFSRLAFKIVEYAASQPYTPSSKTVQYYVNTDGSPGTVEHHAKVVTVVVDASSKLKEVENALNIYDVDASMQQLESIRSIASKLGNDEKKSFLKGVVPNHLLPSAQVDSIDSAAMIDKINIEIERLRGMKNQSEKAEPPIFNRNFGQPAQWNGSILPQLNLQNGRLRTGR